MASTITWAFFFFVSATDAGVIRTTSLLWTDKMSFQHQTHPIRNDIPFPSMLRRRGTSTSFSSRSSRSSGPSLFRTFTQTSIRTTASSDTFLTRRSDNDDPTISLLDLLDVINRHRSLQSASIVRANVYKKFNGRVQHRFIILELEREGRQKIYLRIDRQRDESRGLLDFVARGGKASANDRVSHAMVFDHIPF